MRKSSLGILAAIALLVCVPASSSFAGPHGGGGWHGGGGGWHGGGAWHGGGGWHGGGWHGGTNVVVGLGAPFWGWGWGWGGWYGPGYYGGYYGGYYPYYPPAYYPSAVVVQPQAQPLPSGYWYFCPTTNAYYPDVQTCDRPWVPVAPTPSE
ncbi:MAG TPA: hypothetical protein VMR86_13815 [Myxococcota bacterium]|nr:hypothetical protein [Myxococcota bacterium]